MTVELLQHMGSDITVVNAARVSFNKQSNLIIDPEYECHCEAYGEHEYACGNYSYEGRLSEADAKLISYLAKHNHWTPFAHTALTFRIKAPLFVARQLGKSQVGLVWNEESRRYIDDEPEFYLPPLFRKAADNVKQGSSDEEVRWLTVGKYANVSTRRRASTIAKYAKELYEDMIGSGVAPEMARMVLPQSLYVTWWWSGSLAAFARVCKLRLDAHAQRETQQIAQDISTEAAKLFPVSWAALMEA